MVPFGIHFKDRFYFVNILGRRMKETEKLCSIASLWPEQQERLMLFTEEERQEKQVLWKDEKFTVRCVMSKCLLDT